jgi:hypothetical protein
MLLLRCNIRVAGNQRVDFVLTSMLTSASNSNLVCLQQIECVCCEIAFLFSLPLRRGGQDPGDNLAGLLLLLTEQGPEPAGCCMVCSDCRPTHLTQPIRLHLILE